MDETDYKIASLERKIESLRQQWLKAETDVDRRLIEKRAKLLIWAKEKIEAKKTPYETMKRILGNNNS